MTLISTSSPQLPSEMRTISHCWPPHAVNSTLLTRLGVLPDPPPGPGHLAPFPQCLSHTHSDQVMSLIRNFQGSLLPPEQGVNFWTFHSLSLPRGSAQACPRRTRLHLWPLPVATPSLVLPLSFTSLTPSDI